MAKVGLDMMVMVEEVLTMAEDHVQDNQGHVHLLLVELMKGLVAHHPDPQVDPEGLADQEDMEKHRLQAQEEACPLVVADHHLEVLIWADLRLNADHLRAIHTGTHQAGLRRNVEDQMSRD